MSRLSEAFDAANAQGRPAIVAYVMAGHPDKARALEYARAVLRECDVLEIGVPFSDPVADGPVIERAAVRALAGGARMDDALALAESLAGESDKPLVLMTYYNPVYRRGLDAFAKQAREAGVDGVILPDVPLEESARIGETLATYRLDLVQLASPASPPERIARLADATRGFLYVVSSYGVTGARKELPPEALDLVQRASKACGGRVPTGVGFGVSSAEHVRALHAAGARGVIVGSAIVSRIEAGETPERVGAFVRSLRA